MVDSKLGNKCQCEACNAKFYDLNKSPVVCPKCNTTLKIVQAEKTPPADAPDLPPDDETELEDDEDTLSLEDIDDDDDDDDTLGEFEHEHKDGALDTDEDVALLPENDDDAVLLDDEDDEKAFFDDEDEDEDDDDLGEEE